VKQIIKRLEIIKSSIAIDDEEIIELQIIKLKELDADSGIKNILKKLENLDYGSAMGDIENYIKQHTGMVEYVDSEVLGLKLELKSLEKKLQSLSQEKTEYLNDIEEFNTQYNIHLGDITKNILNLKKDILYKQTQKQQKVKDKYKEDTQIYQDSKDTIDEIKEAIKELEELLKNIDENHENYEEIIRTYNNLKKELNDLEDDLIKQEIELNKIKDDLEDDELFKNYEEAKTFYEEFHHEHENIKEKQSDRFELKDEDIKELKIMWKKACRLCHPDIVTDELKEKANEIMQSLNHAYSRRDINKVKQILLNLENGLVFEVSSDKIDNKEILKSKIEEFRQSIIHIQEEIENIKSDDTFKTISNLENWDEYFEELKNELKVEEKRLEDESKIILEENT
jgi:DNA repair exonuclease SbcCD ATPase subunit